jgi:uncharacterized protein YtpQ (UPF0354 family)
MPGWVWIAVVLGVLLLWARGRIKAWRRELRSDLRAYLAAHRPELKVGAESEDSLILTRAASEQITINLQNMYDRVASLRPSTPEARHEVYRQSLEAIEEGLALQRPTLEAHGARLLPRLLPTSALAEPNMQGLVQQSLGETGLSIVYVIDGTYSVAYVSREHLQDLGLDPSTLHARALDNLKAKFDPAQLDEVRRGGMAQWMSVDTFDAARVLLLPQHLGPDEAMLAVVPNRDTLVLLAATQESAARQLAAASNSGAFLLLAAPLKVTAAGFERL